MMDNIFEKSSDNWLSWIDAYTPKTVELAEDVIDEMQKEIQRLTAEVDRLRQENLMLRRTTSNGELLEENERLRAALVNIAEYWNQSPEYDAVFNAAERTHILALEALQEPSDET